MKSVILFVDENQNVVDKNGIIIGLGIGIVCDEYKEDERNSVDIAQMITLGVTTDDLLKLKASNII